MMRLARVILALSFIVMLPGPTQAGDSPRKSSNSTMARQLMLKHRLKRAAGGALTASLYHNRREWESLPPGERERYRRDALAFLEKAPHDQDKLLKHYERLIKLSAEKREEYRQRARWLKPVVDSFSPQERAQLEKMSPEDRARTLLQRKNELVREGKLKDDPTSWTATAMAPQPATLQATK